MVSSDDGKKEDLSAYSREDLVYKAKLAEQAERCVKSTGRGREVDSASTRGWMTTGRVVRRRRAEASRVPDRARFDDESDRRRPSRSRDRSIDQARDRGRDDARRDGSMIVRSGWAVWEGGLWMSHDSSF